MIKYNFVARSPTGKKIRSSINVENDAELIEIMHQKKYELISYKKNTFVNKIFEVKKITKNDILIFTQNLQMILRAGLPLEESLQLCANATSSTKFATIIRELRKEITKGKAMSVTMSEYPKVFSESFAMMIHVGELGNNLVDVLEYLSSTYLQQIKMKKKFISSLFYPCILFLLSLFVLVLVSFVIVPSFEQIFTEMHVNLPALTVIIINICSFIRNFGAYIVLGLLIASIVSFILFKYSKKGKYIFSKIKLKMPVFGKINTCYFVTKFSKSIVILKKSGNPIHTSLQTAANLISNDYAKEKLLSCIVDVKRGVSLSDALEESALFPQIVLESVQISEKTNSLENTLQKLALLYDDEAESKLNRFQVLIEPISILIITFFVVIIIIAIFIPLFSILDNLGGLV